MPSGPPAHAVRAAAASAASALSGVKIAHRVAGHAQQRERRRQFRVFRSSRFARPTRLRRARCAPFSVDRATLKSFHNALNWVSVMVSSVIAADSALAASKSVLARGLTVGVVGRDGLDHALVGVASALQRTRHHLRLHRRAVAATTTAIVAAAIVATAIVATAIVADRDRRDCPCRRWVDCRSCPARRRVGLRSAGRSSKGRRPAGATGARCARRE